MAKVKKSAPKKAVAKKPVAKKPAVKKAAKTPAAKKASAKPAAKKISSPKPSSQSTSPKARATKAGSAGANFKWDQFLTPLDDRLIIEIASSEKMTAGGLYIPDTVTDTSGNYKGLVLAAGRGHRDDKGKVRPMDVLAGDTVLFSEFTGAKIELMGKEVRILRESEILGIVTKK